MLAPNWLRQKMKVTQNCEFSKEELKQVNFFNIFNKKHIFRSLKKWFSYFFCSATPLQVSSIICILHMRCNQIGWIGGRVGWLDGWRKGGRARGWEVGKREGGSERGRREWRGNEGGGSSERFLVVLNMPIKNAAPLRKMGALKKWEYIFHIFFL